MDVRSPIGFWNTTRSFSSVPCETYQYQICSTFLNVLYSGLFSWVKILAKAREEIIIVVSNTVEPAMLIQLQIIWYELWPTYMLWIDTKLMVGWSIYHHHTYLYRTDNFSIELYERLLHSYRYLKRQCCMETNYCLLRMATVFLFFMILKW